MWNETKKTRENNTEQETDNRISLTLLYVEPSSPSASGFRFRWFNRGLSPTLLCLILRYGDSILGGAEVVDVIERTASPTGWIDDDGDDDVDGVMSCGYRFILQI